MLMEQGEGCITMAESTDYDLVLLLQTQKGYRTARESREEAEISHLEAKSKVAQADSELAIAKKRKETADILLEEATLSLKRMKEIEDAAKDNLDKVKASLSKIDVKTGYEKSTKIIKTKDEVEKAVGRINTSDTDELVGTGFLVRYNNNNYVVTCDHVFFSNSIKESTFVQTGKDAQPLTIKDYTTNKKVSYRTGGEDTLIIRVSCNEDDAAFIYLDESYTCPQSENEKLFSFGYTENRVHLGKSFELTTFKEKTQSEFILFYGAEPGKCSSGSPVVDLNNDCKLCGMIYGYDDVDAVIIIPVEIIIRRLKEVFNSACE